jgi:hypothetical protein
MMMKRLLLTAVAVAFLALSVSSHAEGLFGGSNKLDPSFCKQNNIRQTVIYIDDTMLVSGQNGWLHDIYAKLAATLVPGERTTLVELSPLTGQSTERWTGCWPAYTPAETAKLASQSHIFSTSPLADLKVQQGFFARDLGIAVENIEKAHARSASQVEIDPRSPPHQSIIRALASDGARYSHTQETIRAILYSNLAENSDLGSVFEPLPNPTVDYGTKLGTFLRRSVFYVFGVGTDIKGDGSAQDAIRAFWTAALQSMAANIGGMGTDLNVPNVVPVKAQNFDLLLKDGSSTLNGRLSLLTGTDGTLVDSWLGIVRLRTAALNGTYICNGPADTPSCNLQATTAGGVVTMSPSETVNLSSHDSPTMTGTIGVQGSNVNLPLAADPSKY